MKILITGSNGFIGSNLLELAKHNAEYSEIYTASRGISKNVLEKKHKAHFCVDLSIQSEVEYLFTRIQPDLIFHLAGEPVVRIDNKDVNKAIRGNVETTHNLLRFCPEMCKFIYTSSVIVYGDGRDDYPYSELDIDITKPTSVYGYSKLMAENLINLYTEQGKIIGYNARLCANVGFGATHGILKDFILKSKSNNSYFEILGDEPGSCKPYMYVLDTCAALMLLAKCKYPESYNICNNDKLNTRQISEIVQDELKTNKPIKWLGEKANWVGDNRLIYCSNWNMKEVLNFTPQFETSEVAIRYVVRNSI